MIKIIIIKSWLYIVTIIKPIIIYFSHGIILSARLEIVSWNLPIKSGLIYWGSIPVDFIILLVCAFEPVSLFWGEWNFRHSWANFKCLKFRFNLLYTKSGLTVFKTIVLELSICSHTLLSSIYTLGSDWNVRPLKIFLVNFITDTLAFVSSYMLCLCVLKKLVMLNCEVLTLNLFLEFFTLTVSKSGRF